MHSNAYSFLSHIAIKIAADTVNREAKKTASGDEKK
jgi:hypothetical protein